MTDIATLNEFYAAGATEFWTAKVVASLAAAVCEGRENPVVIETGTFMGTTTNEIYGAVPDNTFVITVEADPARWEQARKNLHEALQHNMLHCTQADAVEFLRNRNDESCDFIFLDDDHRDTHVATEIAEGMRCLRPGGMLVVHDAVGPFGIGNVVRSVGGYVLDLPRIHAGGGLGILQKPNKETP